MPPRKRSSGSKEVTVAVPTTSGVFLGRENFTREELLDAVSLVDRSNQVNSLISVFFVCVNPAIKFSSPFVRKDCQRLIDRLGYEQAWNLALLSVGLRNRPFFPSVNSPGDLWKKLPAVMSAVQRERDKFRGQQPRETIVVE